MARNYIKKRSTMMYSTGSSVETVGVFFYFTETVLIKETEP